MILPHGANAFGRGHQIHQPDMPRALLCQQVQCRYSAAARREHRVNQDDLKVTNVFRKTFVIKLRL